MKTLPPFPDDVNHATTVVHYDKAGYNVVIRYTRGEDGQWKEVGRFVQRFADPIVTDPDYGADGQYHGKHPIKMPTTTDLVVPVDPGSLTEQQGGIQIGNLKDGFQ